MSETVLLLLAGAVLLFALVLVLLRRPADGGALLAGRIEALAAAQEKQADRLALLSEHQAERLAAQEQALADRLAHATATMTEALIAQAKAVGEAIAAQNERLARQEQAIADRIAAQNEALNALLAGQTERVTRSLEEQARRAAETAAAIQERLAVLDAARVHIEGLGQQVGSLAAILSNKQARGAFGEVQLQQIVEDRLPPDAYAFQHVFSTKARADCLIRLPYPPGPVAVDSKFPLESWRAEHEAAEEAARATAAKRFVQDMRKHVEDVASKYIIPGETADGALLFVPSEAIYADLHARFPAVVEEAARRRVYIVSPTTLWAVLGTMRALLQDVRMRAEAGRIQEEVRKLLAELQRFDERVAELRRHFDRANDTIRAIETTRERLARVGERIVAVELGESPTLPPGRGTAP
jgi:DNA recombination protein RmuC